VQFIPLSWASAALKNLSGGVETNRAHAIQTEICGYAAETPGWPDEWLQFIGEHLADLVRAGVPLNLDDWPATVGPEDGFIARPDAPQRMSYDRWNGFGGAAWHQHVPENDHWDGGRIDMARIIGHAKASLGGAPPPPPPPPPPSRPVGPRLLSEGAIGEDVYQWQSRLAGRGYWIAADGVFGPLTDTVTRWFQTARGLDVDGIVGPATLASMDDAESTDWHPTNMGGDAPAPGGDAPAPAAPPWPGRYLMVQSPLMAGDDVRQWQQRMADRGWRIAVDGIYGEQSRRVCVAFQQEKGLAVDGVVGPVTWTTAWTAPIT
jgi:peptidoglycan hydrolase-like protein with peptidoglycan-binding domain